MFVLECDVNYTINIYIYICKTDQCMAINLRHALLQHQQNVRISS